MKRPLYDSTPLTDALAVLLPLVSAELEVVAPGRGDFVVIDRRVGHEITVSRVYEKVQKDDMLVCN